MPPTLAKDMRGDWFSVYLKSHLNLSIAFPTRYLAMSSLFAFRLFPVVPDRPGGTARRNRSSRGMDGVFLSSHAFRAAAEEIPHLFISVV